MAISQNAGTGICYGKLQHVLWTSATLLFSLTSTANIPTMAFPVHGTNPEMAIHVGSCRGRSGPGPRGLGGGAWFLEESHSVNSSVFGAPGSKKRTRNLAWQQFSAMPGDLRDASKSLFQTTWVSQVCLGLLSLPISPALNPNVWSGPIVLLTILHVGLG